MNALGSSIEPLFTEIDCGDNGVKFSVKLDVSGLRSVSGDRISQSVVVGEASFNRNTAETSAAWKAMKHLTEKHLVKLLDFSSRVAHNLDSYNTYDLVIDGMGSLEKIFGQWEVTFGKCESFAVDLEHKQFYDNVSGEFYVSLSFFGSRLINFLNVLTLYFFQVTTVSTGSEAFRHHLTFIICTHNEQIFFSEIEVIFVTAISYILCS